MPESEWDDGGDDAPVTRAFWSGTITFGLVSIPVALYAANRPQGVRLRMVSPAGTPLQRRYFTSRTDQELDADDIVRGYEVEKGTFVLVDDDELERLAPERTRDIDLRQFVKLDEVDPMYFERAYYLTPAGGSNKAYRLLAKVMEETGRAGIATFVLRAKEYLVAIIAENGILRAETLRFADELRTPADIGLPEPAKPSAAQVTRIGREIGKRVAKSLDTRELADHANERLVKLARQKLRAGDDVVQLDEEETGEPSAGRPVIDLMEILKQRMAGVGGEENEGAAADRDDAPAARSTPKPKRKPAAKTKSAAHARPKSASRTKPRASSRSKPKSASKSKPRAASKRKAKSK